MDRKGLQLVDRDAIEAYRQAREAEDLRGSQKKKVLELSATVYGSYLDSSH